MKSWRDLPRGNFLRSLLLTSEHLFGIRVTKTERGTWARTKIIVTGAGPAACDRMTSDIQPYLPPFAKGKFYFEPEAKP